MTEGVCSIFPKILIADDVAFNRDLLKTGLRGMNVEVVEAGNGREVLSLIASHTFILLLLDIEMPDVSGYEVAQIMRQSERTRYTPIIFVAADGMEYDCVQKAYQAGAVDIIAKPFNWTMLRNKVRVFIELHQQQMKLTQMNRDLEAARQMAEKNAKLKADFLANMSHEIRSPMNGILGMSRLLLGRKLQPEQHAWANIIYRSADGLLHIINDILDFSKSEEGKLTIEQRPICLRTIVKDVTSILSPLADEKQIKLLAEIDKDVPLSVMGDEVRIRQIVLNLASNAMKFTDHGHVRIYVTSSGGHIRFEVEDTGIGLSLKQQDFIFEQFVQANVSTTRRFGGTGLGLPICKRLVTLMNGTIGVVSDGRSGSTFWFELPLEVSSLRPCSEQTVSKSQIIFNNLRVLSVDDMQVNRILMKAMLSQAGCVVDDAVSGQDAIEKVNHNRYDLILMDCQMPEMDGFKATQKIRKQEREARRPHTPIIAITADVLGRDREQCIAVGMDDYLAKPIKPEALYAALERNLKKLYTRKKVARGH